MSLSPVLRAGEGSARPAGLPSPPVRRALARFDWKGREAVQSCANAHPYLADLALSFPAALHAIATNSRGLSAATAARALVIAGAPLSAIAAALGLPMWLKKMPPETFTGSIPTLPDSPFFARHIMNHGPVKVRDSATWLAWIASAHTCCGEELAIWSAREVNKFAATHRLATDLTPLGIYAWHSRRPDLRASGFIDTRWHAGMSIIDAVRQAQRWTSRINSMVSAHRRPAGPRVPVVQSSERFWLVQLRSRDELAAEARLMRNCLLDYCDEVANGDAQIWSVRRNGRRLACLELSFNDDQGCMPRLAQLSGVNNDPVADEILRVVYAWLARWPASPILPRRQDRKPDVALWQTLWKPYWQERGLEARLLPLLPEPYPCDALQSALRQVALPRRRHRR